MKKEANKTLGCIKRNLHSCPERVKAQAYISLERPVLECGSTAMGPLQDVPKKTALDKYSDVLRVLLLKHIQDRRDV